MSGAAPSAAADGSPGMAGGGGAAGAERYRGPEFRRLLAAARRSLERTGGELTGRISVAEPDDAERKAIIGITGAYQPAGTKRLTVPLADLDAAVNRGTGLGLVALLTFVGGPLRDRPGETASLNSARAELIDTASASPLHAAADWYRTWLADLGRDGTLTRLASQNDAVLLGQAVRTLEHLAARPANAAPIALPALAALITGSTKSLSHGTTLATLILRALAIQADVGRPASAAERRELWDRSGVIVDDLASRVLVLNIAAQGGGLGEWLTDAARHGTPFQVTLHQLVAHPVQLGQARIYACENPAILRSACAELGPACPPLVCTEGRPSTAFHRLIEIAVRAGSEIWYHGDFDWPGISIAAAIVARYGARAWRMSAGDYQAAIDANGAGAMLAGEPAATPWDPELSERMRAAGCAVYEETVTDQLLTDLSQPQPGE